MNGTNCDNISDKNHENLPQERILSSGIQLRTSARVLKKQKLDLEASLAAAESKKEEKPPEPEVTSSSQPPPPKRRGAKVFWSPEDKSTFFEALNEAGKDLEGMERYMRGKSKKRPGEYNGPCVTSKTRLQIKSFYHRTVLKLCKHIQIPDSVKRSTQELYMLINYGELRKRMCLINERNAQKLKELIYCGSTQLRIKGKTMRIKTPVCRALKRLNQLEESVDEVRLPARVEVLVTPRDNRDRHLVESLGSNARLKTSLSVDTPITNLLSYLQSRWDLSKINNDGDSSVTNNLLDRVPDPGGGNSSLSSSNTLSVAVSVPSTNNNVNTTTTSGASNVSSNIATTNKPSNNSTINQNHSLPDLSECIVAPSINSPPRPSTNQQQISSNSTTTNSTTTTTNSTTTITNSTTTTNNTTTAQNSTREKIATESTISTVASQKSVKSPKNLIRILPKINAQLTKTHYKCGQLVTSSCISLSAHQAKIGEPLASPLPTLIGAGPPPGIKAGKSWAKWHKEGEPIDELVNADICDPVDLPTNTATSSAALSTNNPTQLISSNPQSASSIVSSTSSTPPQPFVPFSSTVISSDNPVEPMQECDSQTVVKEDTKPVTKEESKEEFEARIRKGWSLNNSARLRIADLYLIFGSNGKLELEYCWDGEVSSELPSLVRLLSLAKLWYSGIPSSPRECWACGHKTPNHSNNVNNNNNQSSNNLLLDPKVEVKTEVVETAASTVVVVSPAPTTAGRFRQPLLPAPSSTKRLKSTDETYKFLQLKPKYSNRRGRYRPKNVVVQRMLPLLPKASAPAQSTCTVVTLQVLAGGPAGAGTGEFIKSKVDSPDLKPIAPKPGPVSSLPDLQNTKVVNIGEKISSRDGSDDRKPAFNFLNNSKMNGVSIKEENSSPSNFSGWLGGNSSGQVDEPVSTPPTSPSRILKEGESQWLNAEVSDFSLSSFLGHLESPLKTNGILPLEDTRMSADVDSQLQSLMTESSLDYTAKFADLAAKITGPGSSNGTPTAPS